jgi:hypothetical protein
MMATSLVRGLRALSVAPRAAANGRWIASQTAAAASAVETTAAAEKVVPKYSVVNHKVTDEQIKPEDFFAVIKLGGTQYKVTQVRIMGGSFAVGEKVLMGECVCLSRATSWWPKRSRTPRLARSWTWMRYELNSLIEECSL